MSSTIFSHHAKEAVRVKVKKCEQNSTPEWRKFSVDPQITSLDVLYSLLVKAFDIKTDFSIKYKAFDPAGNEIYLAVHSDWDLDAAFLRIHNISTQTSTEPCLTLQIDVKPFTQLKQSNEEYTASSRSMMPSSPPANAAGAREIMVPLQQSLGASQKYVQHMQTKLPGIIMNQMGKTFSIVQKAFNLSEETIASLPPRPPLSDSEFRSFLDALGNVQRNDELRKAIFFGGIDPSLRRVVWKHILNVYPNGLNGHERMNYMRRKSEYYFKLREIWKTAIKQGCIADDLAYVTSMVRKDVLRTDRLHSFYAGSDDNQNISSLFNILTTYALNHPSVSYCQGMSDIASPLLVTMNDEAQAYICFCAIMARLKSNFMLDGIAMTQKFAHLTEALGYYDPEFWEYLKSQQADDLLFCYRWLLLELKREFPFEDALRMLEVQWSSLKYDKNTDKELGLYEKEFIPSAQTSCITSNPASLGTSPISPSYLLSKQRESPYTKVCALRRQSSSASLSSLSTSITTSSNTLSCSLQIDSAAHRLNQSLDENISHHAVKRRQRRISAKAHQSLDESKMLLLTQEGATPNDGVENCIAHCDNDDDNDDVFTEQTTSLKPHYGKYLPTNPFIEDMSEESTAMPYKSSSFSCNIEDISGTSPLIPKGIAKLQNKNILSNYNAVSNIIAKQLVNTTNVSSNFKRTGSGNGGHFKDLKEKIAATSKKGNSFEDFTSTNKSNNDSKSQQKLVKNFNEFLNFASTNKNRLADKLATTVNSNNSKIYDMEQQTSMAALQTQTNLQDKSKMPMRPVVQFSKNAFLSNDSNDSDSVPTTEQKECDKTIRRDENEKQSFDEQSRDQEYYPMSTEISRELCEDAVNLDRQIFGEFVVPKQRHTSEIEYEKLDKDSLDLGDEAKSSHEISTSTFNCEKTSKTQTQQMSNINIIKSNPFIDDDDDSLLVLDNSIPPIGLCISQSHSLPEVIMASTTLEDIPNSYPVEVAKNAADEIEDAKSPKRIFNGQAMSTPELPAPKEFGGGNPFLMFLCLTLLLQHRNTIIRNGMDYNEIAMHFDKMVRKHDVTRVLNQARTMYIDYLKRQTAAYSQQQQEQKQQTEQN